jgi:pimeloyl-ACP methyl ester carboxylesterase
VSTPPFLDLPDTVRAGRAETARGSFAYLDASPEREPVGTALLVPGFTGGKEDFIALLDPLARRGYRVIAVDQRGQYETAGPQDDAAAYARGELVADLWALRDTLAPGSRLHLVGHSFGGLVARSAALDTAGRLASLTLMSTGPGAVRESETARLLMLEVALGTLTLRQVWDAMREMDAQAGIQQPADPRIATYMRTRWLANAPAGLAAIARQLRTEPDLTDELAREVACGLRTMVLSGARDYAWPVPWQADTARRLGVPHVVVADAAHSPNAENPEVTAKSLADFWDES